MSLAESFMVLGWLGEEPAVKTSVFLLKECVSVWKFVKCIGKIDNSAFFLLFLSIYLLKKTTFQTSIFEELVAT